MHRSSVPGIPPRHERLTPLGRLGRLKPRRPLIALVAVTGMLSTLALVPTSYASAAQAATPPPPGGAGSLRPNPATPYLPKLPSNLKEKNGVPVIPPQAPRPRAHSEALPVPARKIGSFQVSGAVMAFLHQGLGLPVNGSPILTGLRSGSTLTVPTGAGPSLNLGLPRGVAAPSFSHAVLTVDLAADTVTVTAAAPGDTFSVTIAHASTTTLTGDADLTSDLTLRVPLPGLVPAHDTVMLNGTLGYTPGSAATVALSGSLPGAVSLDPGRAELGPGAHVTVTTAGGTRVSGPAILGPTGHTVDVTVSGAVRGPDDLALNVTGRQGQPDLLPGLALAPGATGTVTDTDGTVLFDVQARAAGTWAPISGATLAGGTVEYSDALPAGRVLAAPGIAARTPWVDVTGTVTLASTVSGPGTLAANLASGGAILTAGNAAPVTLTGGGPATTILSRADFGGLLTVGPERITGPLHGTGLVTVTDDRHEPALADASLTLDGGALTASFPMDRSALGLGAAGSLDTAYWTNTATTVRGPSGAAISLPTGLSAVTRGGSAADRPLTVPAAAPAASHAAIANAGPADATTGSYTLSTGVYNFINNTLGIPVGSQTITGSLSGQTLTLTVDSPGPLPVTLPAGITAPVLGDTTITADEATNTVTLNASATSGVTAALQVTITSANSASMADGTNLSSSVTFSSVPFLGGSTISLAGSLGWNGTSLTASLTGTLGSNVVIGNGAVTLEQGSSVTLATGTGLTLTSAAAQIGPGADSFAVMANGSLTDLSNWSISVSDTATTWSPVPSLQVTPNFSGTVTDTAGSVAFDLTTTANPAVNWTPGTGATVTLTSLQVSNMAPPSSAGCPSSVAAGDVWFGAAGTFSYSPASLNDLTAQTCADLTAGTFQVSTGAPSLPMGSLPVQVSQLTLTAGNVKGGFAVTGSATLQINQGTPGVSGQPTFQAALSLSPSGVVVGASVMDLGQYFPALSGGNGTLYVSTSAVTQFDPSTLNLPGGTFNLPQGIAVTLGYTVPQSVANAIGDGQLGGQSQQVVATAGTGGFSINFSLTLGAGTSGVQLVNNGGFGLYLNDVGVSFAAGVSSGVSVTVNGDAYLVLPSLAPGDSGSSLQVSLDASVSASTAGISGNVAISATGTWNTAFGIPGLSVSDLGASLGIADGLPSLAFTASDITLPGDVESAIGMTSTATISITGDISPTTPALAVSINGNGGVALLPLTVFSSDPNVYDSLAIDQASLYVAPAQVTIGELTFPAGFSVTFDASVFGVSVNFNGSVDPSAPSVSFTLAITGGLPPSLGGTGVGSIGGTLSGSLNTSGFSASGYGTLYAGGGSLGQVGFNLSIPGGFDWNAGVNSITQVAQFFLNQAGQSVSQVAQTLYNLGYSEFDIINTLSDLNYWGNQLLSSLASFFGFSSTYYDIWNATSSGLFMTIAVSGGSMTPNENVITWPWTGGYEQDWAFVPSPYSGWYEIVNRNSGQCLSVSGPSTAPGTDLVQYPCFGGSNQIWYMGSVSLATTYSIVSLYTWEDGYPNNDQVIDIQNAYPWQGGTLDIWPANGGWNQAFYLTNSSN